METNYIINSCDVAYQKHYLMKMLACWETVLVDLHQIKVKLVIQIPVLQSVQCFQISLCFD